jgi:predicted HicB family RNase H-like nuclease
MAITKKPKSNQSAISAKDSERAAEAFISGAGKQAEPEESTKKVPFMVRFDADILKRVDEAAKRRGISRSAWVQYTVSRALDQGEG